jgi:hypothetical protein
LIFISDSKFFRTVVSDFSISDDSSGFVDKSTNRILRSFLESLPAFWLAQGWNTDQPPFFHVQTIGHVAGTDQYIPGNVVGNGLDGLQGRDPQLWGSLTDKVLGVSLHPQFGGWFAYRMLVVCHGLTWPASYLQPIPQSFLSDEEKKRAVWEFNKYPLDARWRNINKPGETLQPYDALQLAFFSTRSVQERGEILQLLKEGNY